MKRQTRLRRAEFAAGALAGLALACGASTSRAGWNPFVPGSPIEVGPKSGQIALADFNGDGHVDILVSHPLHAVASLLLGDGRGEFPLPGRTRMKFGYNPSAIAVGDVNGDSQPDLAVASREGNATRMHILLNSGGEFREIKTTGIPAGEVGDNGWKPSLALVDVNGDQQLDLVLANGRQATIDVYNGAGIGQFAPGQTIALNEDFDRYSHVLGDLNGDGRLDLAAAASSSGDEPGRLTVLIGNEQGALVEAPELSVNIPAGAQVKTLADVDGDKRPDIVLTHGQSTTMLVQGKDGKLASLSDAPFDLGHEAFGVVAVPAGFEGNDVLVAATVDTLDVVYAHEGQYQRACNAPMPAGPGAYNVALGDLNGDGKVDIVANSFEGDSLALLLTN